MTPPEEARIVAETEARVVAWLRSQSQVAQEKAEAAVAPPENERLARDYFAAKISLERAALAIERGDHTKDQTNAGRTSVHTQALTQISHQPDQTASALGKGEEIEAVNSQEIMGAVVSAASNEMEET